jgi:hypothetical protein
MLFPRIGLALAVLLAPALFALGPGDQAPALSFWQTWNHSGAQSLDSFRGKTVFVEVFATW